MKPVARWALVALHKQFVNAIDAPFPWPLVGRLALAQEEVLIDRAHCVRCTLLATADREARPRPVEPAIHKRPCSGRRRCFA